MTPDVNCNCNFLIPYGRNCYYGRKSYGSAKTWNSLSSAIKQCSDREFF